MGFGDIANAPTVPT